MRVGILYSINKNPKFFESIKYVEKALIERGFQVQLIDANKASVGLAMFNYIIVAVNVISIFGGKIPKEITNNIKKSAGMTGKHCTAFTDKKLGSFKTLSNLMKSLEQEGLILFSSEVLLSKEYSYKIAKEMIVE